MWADDQAISKLSNRARHIAADVDGDTRRCLLAVSIVVSRLADHGEIAAMQTQ